MTIMLEKLTQLNLSNLITLLFMFLVNIVLCVLCILSANLVEWLDSFKELKHYELILKLLCLITFIAVIIFDYFTLRHLEII